MTYLKRNESGAAIASLALGMIGNILSHIPILGIFIAIIGLLLGIKGHEGSRPGLAVAGIILCIILLMASVRSVLNI